MELPQTACHSTLTKQKALIEFEPTPRTLTLTLTFDLSTPKPLLVLGYPKVIPYTKSEHFVTIYFLSYAPTISVKNALIDPATFTFDLSTLKPCHF